MGLEEYQEKTKGPYDGKPDAGTLGGELERLRKDVNAMWFPFRWYLNRKLDRIVEQLDKSRSAVIRRYLDR